MRYEFKYLVPIEQYAPLRAAVLPFLRPDAFAAMRPGGHYTVRSIYFDTPDFEMYHTKVDGIAHRMKVRLRGYNYGDDHSRVFLEIKRKYEGPILKNRCETSYGVVRQLFRGASMDDLSSQLSHPDNARRFFYQVYSRNLRPTVNVIYDREPYLGRNVNLENDFRLTFDLHLRSVAYPAADRLFDDEQLQYAYPGFFILEVKFNQFCPAWMKPLFEDFQLRKEPASKYVGCIHANRFIRPERRSDLWAKSRLFTEEVPALTSPKIL